MGLRTIFEADRGQEQFCAGRAEAEAVAAGGDEGDRTGRPALATWRRLPSSYRMTRLFLFFLLLGQNGLHLYLRAWRCATNQFASALSAVRVLMRWCRRPARADPRSNCARTSASSLSRLLEWVLPAPRPSSAPIRQESVMLDFHLAREIVDTNLTHPASFRKFSGNTVSRSWQPRGFGCLTNFCVDCLCGKSATHLSAVLFFGRTFQLLLPWR